MKEKIVLIGFGGHARSIADSIKSSENYEIAGYTDEKIHSNSDGYTFLGTDKCLKDIYSCGVHNACIAIGYMGNKYLRDKLYQMAKNIGFNLPIIIDPSAIIGSNVKINEGTFIGKGCIINSESKIGKMCIINTGAIIEHGSVIGDFSHIAIRAVLCGETYIGEHCFIGANSTVIQGIKIGSNTIIGAGAVVINDFQNICTAFGVPAKPIKYRSV